eukprot:1721064-Pleurochrysis_carterae.AAC.2
MSVVVAVAEVAIVWNGFKNVDLFSQGVYQMRARAKGMSSGAAAVPVSLSALPAPEDVPSGVSTAHVLRAHVLDASGDLCTQSFRVRYCEEEVLLRAIGRLRIELILGAQAIAPGTSADVVADDLAALCEPIELELRLMHARSTTEFDGDGDVEMQSEQHFSQVACQRLRLQLPLPGGSAFFPLTFDEWHFCYAPVTMHATVL